MMSPFSVHFSIYNHIQNWRDNTNMSKPCFDFFRKPLNNEHLGISNTHTDVFAGLVGILHSQVYYFYYYITLTNKRIPHGK